MSAYFIGIGAVAYFDAVCATFEVWGPWALGIGDDGVVLDLDVLSAACMMWHIKYQVFIIVRRFEFFLSELCTSQLNIFLNKNVYSKFCSQHLLAGPPAPVHDL
jgi:hypothetical protein